MTNNQKDAFSRVQASVSRFQYEEIESGTYRTEDLASVLEYADSLSAKLEAVKEDLLDLKTCIMATAYMESLNMIDSTLLFLGEE